MRLNPTILGAVVLSGAGLLAYTLPGHAQGSAKTVELYSGGGAAAEGLRLGGWGSGKAAEDRATRATGDASIRVETNGYYAGARIQFEVPRDITDQKNNPNGFLEFGVKFRPGTLKKLAAAGGGGGGYPGGQQRGGGGGGGGGYPGAVPGGGGGGYPGAGGPSGADGEQTLTPDTHKLKVLLICEEGTFVATDFPVTMIPRGEEGWYSVALPFVAFRGLEKSPTAKIKELRVFGDSRDTFWIGEIRTTTDEEPITVEPLDNVEVSVGEAVEFRAQATGGISPLQYSWDFDKSDGIQEDEVGQTVLHVFRKASPPLANRPGESQPYVVTLTVKDLSGAKKPVRRELDVTVNP